MASEKTLILNFKKGLRNIHEIIAEADGIHVSRGDLGPFRVKIRSASFNNISITPWLLRGVYVPDIVTILASLYFILGDIDR